MPLKQVLLAPNELVSVEDHEKADRFPFFASLKLDGNRCLVMDGKLYTRSMKQHVNVNLVPWLRGICELSKIKGWIFDGELYSHELTFSEMQSIFRAKDKPIPEGVALHVFDCLTTHEWADGENTDNFMHRQMRLARAFTSAVLKHVVMLKQPIVKSAAEARALYEKALAAGYEGLILRNGSAQYKWGRATVNENIIYKMKPFDLLDAQVIGFQQQEKVKDDAVRSTNEMGRTARTSKAADHELVECMGALRVRDERGREFNIGWGRGWNYEKRTELWKTRDSLIGQWVEVRHMAVGEKDLPRMPQLVRFRESKE